MTPELITAVGWSAAALFAVLHVRTRQRLVLIARATHELRGPLSAARLGLGTITTEPGRVAAIDLELARAGRALEDLTAAPSGARRAERIERVDLIALARAYAPAWTTLAAAHGAGLRLEVGEPAPGGASRLGPGEPAPGDASRVGPGNASRVGPGDASRVGPGEPAARHLRLLPAPANEAGSRPQGDAAAARGGRAPLPGLAQPGGRREPRAAARRRRQPRAAPAPVTPVRWPDPIPPSHRWTWRPPGAAVVLADPFRVAQAVANLVANAAEHGGGLVRVRVARAGERVWIEVADDGPGLPAPVPALVASARRRSGRRGHGLAIASAIAEQLGGRLAAIPASEGARLLLDLPAAR